jgi:hypothetical protein
LIMFISPFEDEEKYAQLKSKVTSYFDSKGYSSDFLKKDDILEFPILGGSNLYYDFEYIIRPEQLMYRTESKVFEPQYEFQQTLFLFFKLRFVRFLISSIDNSFEEIANTDKSKTINSIDSAKRNKVKIFEDYFIDSFKGEINIILDLFLKESNPKKIAILTSILSINKVIFIEERGQSSFYKALYNYIDKPYPKNDNFNPIGRQLTNKEEGLEFNENDLDYKRFNKMFKDKYEDLKKT